MAFTACLLATLYLFQLSTAQDPDCRNVSTVINSAADPQTNVNAGGHIWQHINGLSAKPTRAASGATQNDKSLFNSENDFTNAYSAARGLTMGSFVKCPASGAQGTKADSILASSIGVITARRCTSVTSGGLCSASTSHNMMGRNVIFCYKYVNSQWIMNTAYPDTPRTASSESSEEDCFSEDGSLNGGNGSGAVSSSAGAILLMMGLAVSLIGLLF